MNRTRQLKSIACAALALTLGACAATVDSRGYVANPDSVARIRPGEQNRDEIVALLGSPSTTDPFDNNTWLYIGKKTETVAFFDPKIVEQKVIAVRFDDAGMVTDVRQLGMADLRKIDPVDRITPTAGKEMGFLEQMFANLGRFNKDKNALPQGAPRRN